MNIKEKYSGQVGTKYFFDKENCVCQIFNDENDLLVEVDTHIPIYDEYSLKNYTVKLLFNDRENCSEDSIYQVKVEGNRVGWIFPIQSIHSVEHSYIDNIHFLKYAYVAWIYLLEYCNIEIENFKDFDFFSEFKSYTNILVLDNENCKNVNFDYEKYIVSLFKYGYSESGKGNLYTPTINIDKAINLKRHSKELDDIQYINELFKKQIPQETNPVSRFYIYYQLIEILITKVFNHLFAKFVDGLKSNSENLFDKKEDLNKYANEKERLKRLCGEYTSIEYPLKDDLYSRCRALLEYTNSKVGEKMADCLYLVRCLLVHKMYVLNSEAEKMLEDIDDLFLELVIELILSFKIPDVETV